MNTIDYTSLSEAITELSKIGLKEIVTKLENILENNEVEKPKLHNRKEDKTTSYYRVNLAEEELEVITNVFLDLEVGSLTEDGEVGNSTDRYVKLLNNWSNINGETASL
jgi:hypothetical protein